MKAVAAIISGAALALKFTLGVVLLEAGISKTASESLGNCTEFGNWQPCPTSDPRMNPTYEAYRGQDVVWQIPANPRGVLFVVNGRYKGPLDFFDRGPKCETCFGLPEERATVLEALDRGYAVLSLKSIGLAWVPWPPDASDDVKIATGLVQTWTEEHSLDHLPLVAWGHSIGGDIVATLGLLLPIRALVVMCSHLTLEMMDIYLPGRFPPMFFAHMDRDGDTVPLVEKWVSFLREGGVSVREKRMLSLPLAPHFFSNRIVCLSDRLSENLYRAYKTEGWLDDDDLLMIAPNDPDCNWESVLRKNNALPFCERYGDLCLASHVLEQLYVAYALHTFTREANGEIFSWLEETVFQSQRATPLADIRLNSTGITLGGVRT